MKRETPMHVLVAGQLFVTSIGLIFFTVVRPKLLASYASFGADVPMVTRVALSSSVPVVAVAALVVAVVAWRVSGKRGRRLRAVAAALTVSGLSICAAALAALMPLLQ